MRHSHLMSSHLWRIHLPPYFQTKWVRSYLPHCIEVIFYPKTTDHTLTFSDGKTFASTNMGQIHLLQGVGITHFPESLIPLEKLGGYPKRWERC